MKKLSAPPSRKWTYVSITLIGVLAIYGILFSYAYLSLQSQLSNVQSQFSNLPEQIERIQQQLEDAQLQHQNIIQRLTNQTSFVVFPQVFDLIKESVVLIVTNFGQGSGFVYDMEGHIVTNNHVIENAVEIEITFIDGTVVKATIIGSDPYSDLAVIKVNLPSEKLHPVTLGNSSELDVGDPVAAIGNPFGLSDSMTAGIISQLGRELLAPRGYQIIDVIQVDAAINPGNSGGPLVNMKGEVVGVNTAIVSETGVFSGVGFAIPSDTVKRELQSIITTGQYKHPWMGISGLDIFSDLAETLGLKKIEGFLIIDVIESSPADKAGLSGGNEIVTVNGQQIKIGGDVILGVDDINIRRLNELVVYLERNKKPEDVIDLKIIRNNQESWVQLILGERPPP